MALKAECLLYILFFGILDAQQQQKQSLDVKFDEPSVKYAKLGSKTSMTCYIYGDPKDVTTIYRTIQIVKVLDESSEEILTEGKNVLSGDNYKIDINPSSYPPYKYHILLTILSAKINDDRQFICRFTDLDGDVHESRIRLQVVKTPDQLICRKKNVYSKLQVTCSAVVYPQGRCNVISSNDGSSLSSSITYSHFKEPDNLFLTSCLIEVSKSYVFKITIAPDILYPTNFTLHSNSISESGSDYQVDDDEGYYVTRNIIIITISLSIGGLVLIVCIIFWVRRHRKARSTRAGNSGIVLSTPSALVPDNVLIRCNGAPVPDDVSITCNGAPVHDDVLIRCNGAPVTDDVLIRCNEYETCFQMSPPPYAIACNKDDMPPSYPDVVLNSGSQMEEHSSQGTQLESPPPY